MKLAIQIATDQSRGSRQSRLLPGCDGFFHQFHPLGDQAFQRMQILISVGERWHAVDARQRLLYSFTSLLISGQVLFGSGEQIAPLQRLCGLELGDKPLQGNDRLLCLGFLLCIANQRIDGDVRRGDTQDNQAQPHAQGNVDGCAKR